MAVHERRIAGGKSVCHARPQKTSSSPHPTWQGERQIIQAPFTFPKNTAIAFFVRLCYSSCTCKRIVFLTRQENSKEINVQDNSYQSDINKAVYNVCNTLQSTTDKGV